MRIHLRNLEQQRLFEVQVDQRNPSSVAKSPDGRQEIILDWQQTLDDKGHLRRCPACGCRELFVRKDFPQITGFALVALAAVVAIVLFGFKQVLYSMVVLLLVVVVDALIFFFTGKCLVCYQCRSEFRDLPIRKGHAAWELATGEKYRQLGLLRAQAASGKNPDAAPATPETTPPSQATPAAAKQ